MDTVKEDLKFVGVREERAKGGVSWRQMTPEENSPQKKKEKCNLSSFQFVPCCIQALNLPFIVWGLESIGNSRTSSVTTCCLSDGLGPWARSFQNY